MVISVWTVSRNERMLYTGSAATQIRSFSGNITTDTSCPAEGLHKSSTKQLTHSTDGS